MRKRSWMLWLMRWLRIEPDRIVWHGKPHWPCSINGLGCCDGQCPECGGYGESLIPWTAPVLKKRWFCSVCHREIKDGELVPCADPRKGLPDPMICFDCADAEHAK